MYQYQPQQAPIPPKKKKWPIVLAITIPSVLVIAVVVLLISGIVNAAKNFAPGNSGGNLGALPGTPYVGILHIEGTIIKDSADGYDHEWALAEVKRLRDDDSNLALLLSIDSPGGAIYETDELYLAIEDYKQVTGRPVFAWGGSLMASGGYYLAVTAEDITVNRNCWTGSIGVNGGTVIDISEFLEKNNIHVANVTAGENKAMGGLFGEFTDEQKAIYQSLVDESYSQFVSVVAEGRSMNANDVTALADGRIYSANQALSNGLVDGIGSLDDAEARLEEKLGYVPEYIDLENKTSYGFLDYFLALPQGKTALSDLRTAIELKDSVSAEPSYLCELFK